MADNLYLVGEFSRLTHLTAKTLRHYHDVDVLVPALGEHAHTAGIAAPGPIRENYLVSFANTDDPSALKSPKPSSSGSSAWAPPRRPTTRRTASAG